ncbi:MAG: hypothetical protein J5860_04600 [Clostridia bacterium]|nr:hypothetical protein [Clostridia bacterium]
MKKTFYFLEYNDGKTDRTVGYFSSPEKLAVAKEACASAGVGADKLAVTEYSVDVGNNQKFLYALTFVYSVSENGEYVDHVTHFEPKTTERECEWSKYKLLRDPAYQLTDGRIYQTRDGFKTEKLQIDVISSVGLIDISKRKKDTLI